MEIIKIAKALIKCNDQYLVVQSDSLIKKWKFFDAVVSENENEIGQLSRELTEKLNINQSPGKLFCEINLFQNGKQFDIKAYKINIHDMDILNDAKCDYKMLLLSELKTLKWEDIDKVIFQKLLDKNSR